MKNIIVLGGSGFIGSNFIKELSKKKKYNIINIDKLSYSSNNKYLNDIKSNYFFYRTNIGNSKKINDILKKYKPFRIINFAAYTHVDRSIENSSEFIENNVLELDQFLNCLKNFIKKNKIKFKFHQVSTDEVFGDLEYKSKKKFTENQFYNPSNPYAASKAAADQIVMAWSRTNNIPVSISYCSNNFGENQFVEKFIPKTILSFSEKKKIEIYGKGKNIRNWIYVRDHCLILQKILLSNIKGKFNISSTNYFSNYDLAKMIFNIMKIKNNKLINFNLFYKFVKDRPGHDRKYSINSTKVMKTFNWKNKGNFKFSLLLTISWYLRNKTIYKKLSENLKRQGLDK